MIQFRIITTFNPQGHTAPTGEGVLFNNGTVVWTWESGHVECASDFTEAHARLSGAQLHWDGLSPVNREAHNALFLALVPFRVSVSRVSHQEHWDEAGLVRLSTPREDLYVCLGKNSEVPQSAGYIRTDDGVTSFATIDATIQAALAWLKENT